EDGIRDFHVTGVQTCALPILGKTSLAFLIAKELDRPFFSLSAIKSGVKEVREVIEKAEQLQNFNGEQPILFIDEIHRFSKSQQRSEERRVGKECKSKKEK